MKSKQRAVRGPTGGGRPPVTSFCYSHIFILILVNLNHLHPRKKHVILYTYSEVRCYASHNMIRVEDDDDDDDYDDNDDDTVKLHLPRYM